MNFTISNNIINNNNNNKQTRNLSKNRTNTFNMSNIMNLRSGSCLSCGK